MPKKTAQKNIWRRPKGGWPTSSTEKSKSKKVKLALLVLGFVVLLILIGKIISIINNFSQPVYAESNIYRSHVWKKGSNINIVIKTDSISVLSFNPIDKKATVIDLPPSLYINVPGGFGNWRLESIYSLGQSEKDKIGGKLLKRSVAGFLGIPIEGYISFSNEYEHKKVTELIASLRDGLWNGFAMIKFLKTDLTPRELLDLNLALNSIRFDKIESYDLAKMNILDESKLSDGTNAFTSDSTRIDGFSQKLADTNIVSEKLSIAVFNATNVSGLAQKAARIISNLGGNVIISTNAVNKLQKSMIVVKKESNENPDQTKTAEVLGEVFTSDCSNNLKCDIIVCEVQKCKIDDPQILDSRAQVNVVLGEDFYNRY